MITAIINNKGGVAKTTTTLSLGHAFRLLGKTVLIVDLDRQRNSSSFHLKKRSITLLLSPIVSDISSFALRANNKILHRKSYIK